MAVYGHILHPTSTYTLTVVLRDETQQFLDEYANFLDDEDIVIFDGDQRKVGGIGTGAHKIPQVSIVKKHKLLNFKMKLIFG